MIFISFFAILYGLMLGSFNVAIEIFTIQLEWNPSEKEVYVSLIVTIAIKGASVGNFIGKYIIAKGRWLLVIVSCIGVIVSTIPTLFMNIPALIVGRFFFGVFSGNGLMVTSKYIDETCPDHIKK